MIPAEAEGPEAPAFSSGGPQLSERDFRLFRDLIHQEAGINLNESKRALLVGRLTSRLRTLGISRFSDYYELVSAEGSEERVRMLDCICTNETHFFREPQHFTFLEERLFPIWEAKAAQGDMEKRIRVWSAACSSGEEPYTLAMVLLAHFPPSSGWTIEILATDLSTKVLEAARVGVWNIAKAAEIPTVYLKRFMLRGIGSQVAKMKAGEELRQVIRFARMNLNHERYPVSGPFELIFCRNVLIYFAAESKPRIVNQLLSHLTPSGYLFLGHSETLAGISNTARAVIPTVYSRGEGR